MATSRETKKFVDSAGVTKIYQTFKSDLQTAVGVIDQAKANTSHTHVMADITDFSGGGGGVGQEYKVSGVTKGEIFNDYTNNIASGAYSHAEGKGQATGDYAHAEGGPNTDGHVPVASGESSHAEGTNSRATAKGAHAEGASLADNDYAHSEGVNTRAKGYYSHAGGCGSNALGAQSFATGGYSNAQGTGSFSVGPGLSISGVTHIYLTGAAGATTYTVTGDTQSDYYGVAFGDTSAAIEERMFYPVISHSGQSVTLSHTLNPDEAWNAHEVGIRITCCATNTGSVAFGTGRSLGQYSFIAGSKNRAEADYSVAMGFACRAANKYAVAFGSQTVAGGSGTLTAGTGTIAAAANSVAFGKYNTQNANMLFQIGQGTSGSARADVFSIDLSGNTIIAGNATVGGNLTVTGELIVPSTAGTSVNSMWIV